MTVNSLACWFAAVLLLPLTVTAEPADGSLLPNGGLEETNDAGDWPRHWSRPQAGGSYENEDGNHFIRLTQTAPGELVLLYKEIPIPDGVRAVELTWRQRVSGLKIGEQPWFDARVILDVLNVSGEKLADSPPAQYRSRDSNGWESRRFAFLIPAGGRVIKFMPCLFRARAGVFDLDDFALCPVDSKELEEAAAKAAAQREAELRAKYVPPEEPERAKWPKTLTVSGNKVIDSDGREVWLQGVNAGGLEVLPLDSQPVKSTVVAIDEWKANCVRVPVKEEFWRGKSPHQTDGGKQYRGFIDQIITLAANRGAYVVVDLHRFRAPKPEHAEFWKEFAAQYKDHPAVLFDLFNEPHDISWDVWKNGGWVSEKTGADESAFLSEEEKRKNQGFESVGMQAMVDAARSTGAKNIVIVSGLGWSYDLSGIADGYALDDRNGNGIMYSWHTYNWHRDWAKALPAAVLERHPVFLGEVGADVKKMDFIPLSAQEDPYTFIPDILGFVQKNRIHWTGWCFHPRHTPLMVSDWNYTPTPYWGAFAKDALAGKQFELKKTR